MPRGIVEYDQFAAAQNFSAEFAHRSSWDERITGDRLPMAVHIKYGGSIGLIRSGLLCLPVLPGPLRHHLSQVFGCSCMGQASEKPLGGALTVGPLAAGQDA